MRRNRIAAYIAVMLVCSLMMSAAYVWAGETAVTDAPSADVDGKITLLLAGDIMCQSGQQEYEMRGGKFDFHREFKYVREIIQSGDIALANLETNVSPSSPLSMKKQKKYGKPYLNAPDEFMYALKNAGFDGLVNANNHNCDTGIKGLKETIESQNAYGMEHTGIFRSEKDKRYMILKEEGINVGVISYYTYMNSSKKILSKSSAVRILIDIRKRRSGKIFRQ